MTRARRTALLGTVLLLAAACRGASGNRPIATGADPIRPNIVLVLTDDQRWDSIGRCLGTFDGYDRAAGTSACMPQVQADLMASGTTFRRGYVTTALCCPSRSSILSGRFARRTGVLSNEDYAHFDESSTIATWLQGAGYRTALIGKYMNGYGKAPTPAGHVPPGWEVWHAFWESSTSESINQYTKYPMIDAEPGQPATNTTYTMDQRGPRGACAAGNYYATDFLCYRALQFLDAPDVRPFFLYLATSSPHMSAIAPARWKGWATGVVTPTYPNLNVIPSPNPPPWVPKTPLTADRLSKLSSQFRSMLGTNRAVDDAVGVLHDRLAADGRLATTVWVFLSDNGFARGEHRWAEKRCAYEECHRVPFVVVCPPAVCPGAVAGAEDVDHPVLNIDLAPTLAELAGVTPATTVDGRSMVGLLNGTEAGWRDGFLQENFSISTGRPNAFVARWPEDGHDYKYIETRGSVRGYELYDLTADPWELTNLAGDTAHEAVQSWLVGRLRAAIAAGD